MGSTKRPHLRDNGVLPHFLRERISSGEAAGKSSIIKGRETKEGKSREEIASSVGHAPGRSAGGCAGCSSILEQQVQWHHEWEDHKGRFGRAIGSGVPAHQFDRPRRRHGTRRR